MSAATAFDPDSFKQATRDQWDKAARGWDESSAIVRDWLYQATEAMLNMAGVQLGSRVLDVAAGAGDQTLDIAARIGPNGHVLATDLSAEILEYAKRKLARAGYGNIAIQVADGESLAVEEAHFDAVVCRLGLMLMPDPSAALREMSHALKPGGRVCCMVFSTPTANPCVAIAMSTALKHAGHPLRDPYQPGGLFSLGKPGLMDDLFRQAGFRDVATTRISAPFKLASASAYLQFIRSSASPILQILDSLDDTAKHAAWTDVELQLNRFNTAKGWEGQNELLLTAARR